jgi:hypothetical protein
MVGYYFNTMATMSPSMGVGVGTASCFLVHPGTDISLLSLTLTMKLAVSLLLLAAILLVEPFQQLATVTAAVACSQHNLHKLW